MCVFLAYEQCVEIVKTLVVGLYREKEMQREREREREREVNREANREAEKEIVTLLPNVICMQMTDKELRQRRMETVTTATNVAVATEIS